MAVDLEPLIAKIADREGARTEAMVQADIRSLLLAAPLDLSDDVLLESQVGDQRRIDVEVGATVIEVKKDLRKGNVLAEAVKQLRGYVQNRQEKYGIRYVGVLTDGCEWRCYNLIGDSLTEVSTVTVSHTRPNVDALLIWLEGVLATARDVKPTPDEVRTRLGAGSSAYAIDRATLAGLYSLHGALPSVRIKRRLWARLLETALGTQFDDSDALFVEHTLLVNSAELIAHAVLGLPITDAVPEALLTGVSFDQTGVRGVVEADFFDWVIEVPGGDGFVRALARRLSRFDWSEVQHDILKVLYESIILPETRKKLGEYYTPDWLAQQVVEATVHDPLHQRVLDPACGSGTFVFHAVRRYLAAAKFAGMPDASAIEGVTRHVLGMDLHPVAVTLARVTYLLAIGKTRLARRRGDVRVPVFLGDSMQWSRNDADVLKPRELSVPIADGKDLVGDQTFRFPMEVLADAETFDKLVQEMAERSIARAPGDPLPSALAVLRSVSMPASLAAAITPALELMCLLHDQGRDHIWSYYVRNMARPVWLSCEGNRVDVLVGNPPWLAYRFMPATMQTTFREMSASRGLWAGSRVTPHQDLSGLFAARVIQLYLQDTGQFAFVLPDAALDREHYAGFRRGDYTDTLHPVRVAFSIPWDLRRLRPHFFPRGASVAFGRRADTASPMPMPPEVWTGKLPAGDATWKAVGASVTRTAPKAPSAPWEEGPPSYYHQYFSQGATLVPRMLFVVQRKEAGPLGMTAGKAMIESERSVSEKKPWRDFPALTGVVETEFLRPMYQGESVLPFRMLEPKTVILPVDYRGRIYPGTPTLELYKGLSAWWRKSEAVWLKHRSSDKLTLVERMNYQKTLSNQFRIEEWRVLYNRSGMHLCASRVRNSRAVIIDSLYWANLNGDEALFLVAILNAPATTRLVRPLMSFGKDERDIHKHVWKLPIPQYDPASPLHAELATLGKAAEDLADSVVLDPDTHFAASRRRVREALEASDIGPRMDQLVTTLLTQAPGGA